VFVLVRAALGPHQAPVAGAEALARLAAARQPCHLSAGINGRATTSARALVRATSRGICIGNELHVAVAYGADDDTLEADRVARRLATSRTVAKTLLDGFRA
jgi:hypothetical protein